MEMLRTMVEYLRASRTRLQAMKVIVKRRKPVMKTWLDFIMLNKQYRLSIDEYFNYHFDSCSQDFRDTFLPYEQAEVYWKTLNPIRYAALARDKFMGHCIMSQLGIPHSELLLTYSKESGCSGKGVYHTEEEVRDAIRKLEVDRFIVKPAADSAHGSGVGIYSKAELTEGIEGSSKLHGLLSGGMMLFEKLVEQNAQMASFNSSSVNTVRIVTALYPDGDVKIIGSFLKIGRAGSCIDNAGSGGNVDCGVNSETGELYNALKFTSWDDVKQIAEHPDSKTRLNGTKIENWDAIVTEVKSFQARFPWLKTIGWDVALTGNGPRIIEINNWWDTTGQLFIGRGWHKEVKVCYDAWKQYYAAKK